MTTVERVAALEVLMGHLISNVQETSSSVKSLSEEMKEFKDEMKDFKDEMRTSKKEMDKKWGDLANRMGTVVEDLIVPNVKDAISTAFGKEISFISTKIRKHLKLEKLRMEIDVLAIARDTVYLIETKTTPTKEKIDDFEYKLISGDFIKLFPEYKQHSIVQIFAAVNIPKNLQNYIFDKKMYPMVMKGDIMEIVIPPLE